jgi:hypothetical protein
LTNRLWFIKNLCLKGRQSIMLSTFKLSEDCWSEFLGWGNNFEQRAVGSCCTTMPFPIPQW